MATRTPARPPSARRPPARGSARKKRATSRSSAPSALREALRGHEADVAGLTLVLLAVLAALGTYLDLAGPVGRAADDASGWLVGLGRVVLPLPLGALGIALIRGPRASDPRRHPRLIIGSTALGLAWLGLLHVVRGPDRLAWGGAALRRAGGAAGMLVAQPLQKILSPVGASVVLVALGLLGLLIVTRTTLRAAARQAAHGAARASRPVAGAARRIASQVSTLSSQAPAQPRRRRRSPDLYDVDAEPVDDPFDPDALAPDLLAPDLLDAGLLDPDSFDDVIPLIDEGVDIDPDDLDLDDLDAGRSALAAGPGEQLAIDLAPKTAKGHWKLPPLDLLVRTEAAEVDHRLIEEGGRTLEAALAAHGVETRLVGMTVGPSVTRYELELGPGVKVARVTSLNKDIAYAMASPDVRILAPIPGRSAIGVEVPNKQRQLVALGDLLASPEAKKARHPLEVAVGRDINGRAVMMNLAATPHLLVAGATGAGKSSCINSIVTSLLVRSTPDDVRMILIDPKRVEMGQYNRLPHLLTQVVTVPKRAANALNWAVKEMERRYDLLHAVGVRDITGYNAAFDRGDLHSDLATDVSFERLPFIVIVVDELNDLMMVAARDVEDSICRIAQMARAVGIHLVIATQRPSVNVITGVIKANIPARMAFAVSSLADSRVILDQGGAERLIGQGDMLLLGPTSSIAQRIQGAWVSEEEVRRITAHWRRQCAEPSYVEGVEGDDGPGGQGSFGFSGNSDDTDDETLVLTAMDLVVRSQLGSTSMLQRKLKVGFARAGRLMDLLEQRGVVGPSEGSKARAVLMTVEELDELRSRNG